MCFQCQQSKGHAFLWTEWGKLSRSTSLIYIFMLIHTSRTYLYAATKYSFIQRFGFAWPSSLMSKSQSFWPWTWRSFMVFRYHANSRVIFLGGLLTLELSKMRIWCKTLQQAMICRLPNCCFQKSQIGTILVLFYGVRNVHIANQSFCMTTQLMIIIQHHNTIYQVCLKKVQWFRRYCTDKTQTDTQWWYKYIPINFTKMMAVVPLLLYSATVCSWADSLRPCLMPF